MKLASLICAASLFVAGVSHKAEAALLLTIQEIGPDVVMDVSGGLNTAGMTAFNATLSGSTASTTNNFISMRLPAATPSSLYGLSTQTYPFVPSTTTSVQATSRSGDIFTLYFASNTIAPGGYVALPGGYVSNSPVSSSALYAGQSLASMNLLEGDHVQTFLNGEQMTVRITSVAAVPLPASLPLMLGALAGAAALRKRRRKA